MDYHSRKIQISNKSQNSNFKFQIILKFQIPTNSFIQLPSSCPVHPKSARPSIFPPAYNFFMSFTNQYISPMISMKEGFSFALRILLAFGIVFELPLAIFFLARLGLVTSDMLRRARKYAILCIFAVSALLTPPDLFTQTFMAGPVIVLYEASIWIARFFGRREPTGKKEESGASTE